MCVSPGRITGKMINWINFHLLFNRTFPSARLIGFSVLLLLCSKFLYAGESYVVPVTGDLRYATHYGKLDAGLFQFLIKAKVNLLQWHGCFHGYDGLPDRNRLNSLMFDMGHVIKQAHAGGMKILFYIGPVFSYGDPVKRTQLFHFYDTGWDSYADYLGPKPLDPIQWVQRDRALQPRIYTWGENSGYYLCPNDPSARQYVKGLIKLVVAAGADGVFFDGPFFKDGVCYCEDCRNKFGGWIQNHYMRKERKRLFGVTDVGSAIPDEKNVPLRAAWKRFFTASLQEYLLSMSNFAKELKPDFILTANYNTRNPHDSIAKTGQDFQRWTQGVDIAFCESNYKSGPCLDAGKKMSNSALYKYLVGASNNKPVALLKTAVEGLVEEADYNLTKLCIAEASANQAAWQFYKIGPFAQKAAVEYNQFFYDHRDLLVGWEQAADVAVLSSPQQVFYGFKSFDAAISRILSDNHICHRMITEQEVQSSAFLQKTQILLLPYVPVVSEECIKAIEKYVSDGGNLLTIGESGGFDLEMQPRLSLEKRLQGKIRSIPFHAVRCIDVGKGSVYVYPMNDLPWFIRGGISERQLQPMKPLPKLLRWIAKNPLVTASGLSDHVEINIMKIQQPLRSEIALHMINYGVDKNGNIDSLVNYAVSLRLPAGENCRGVELYSPDFEVQGQALAFRAEKKGNANIISVTVPELKIYNVVVCYLEEE